MSDPRVTVIAPDGTPGTVPASQVHDIVEAGGKLPTKNEAAAVTRQAELEDKYDGTIEGTVAPLAAGAARGLTLGGSDVALSRLGGEGVRRRLLDYKEYAPAASVGGELGGIALGAALGDEAGLGALPNAVSRLGERAGAGVAERLGGGALARGAGVLAQGAAEGAVYGAGSAVSEASLHDAPLTGEALVGGVATGAAGGMIASGLIHGAGSALGAARGAFRPSAGAYEAMAEREFGEAAPGVGKALAEKTPSLRSVAAEEGGPYRVAGTRSPADAAGDAYIEAVGGEKKSELGEIWKNRQVAFNDGAERIEQHSRDLQKAITEQQTAAKTTDMATFGDAKVNHMDRLVDKTKFPQQADEVLQWMSKAQEAVDLSASDTAVTKLSPAARKEFDGHMARLHAAAMGDDSTALFKAADDTKRFLGRYSGFGNPRGPSTEAEKMFNALYQDKGGLMQTLQSPVWGEAASKAQTRVNAAITDNIAYGGRFKSGFVTGHGAEGGVPTLQGNSEKVSSFLGRLTKSANDNDAQGVRDFIATRRKFLDATAESYDHGAPARKAIAAERASLDRMEETFEKATKETALINQVKRMHGEEQAQRIGGAIGLVTDTLSKPVTTLQRLAQIESHTQSILKKIQGGSERLAGVSRAAEPAAGLAPPKGAGKGFFSLLMDGMAPAADRAGAAARAAGTVGVQKTFDKRARAIAALQTNPGELTARVGDALGPVADVAPKATAAATATALAGLQFLASKMPPSRQDPYSLQPQLQQASRASDSEIAKHARYLEALDNPTIVLTEAAKGTLSRDHVEAVKAVYPKLYAEMQQQVMRSLIDSKSELPYGKRIQLGILLDIPTDKTLSPEFQTAIQATYSSAEKAGAEPPTPTLARPLNIAGSLSTGTQTATAEGLEKS